MEERKRKCFIYIFIYIFTDANIISLPVDLHYPRRERIRDNALK